MTTPTPDPAIVAIKQAMQQGNVPQAMALLQPLLTRQPVHAEAHFVMSMIALMTRGPAAAEPFARTAHQADPASYDFAVQVYTCASLQGRAKEAVEGLEPLTRSNPSDPRAWVLLQTSLIALNRIGDAERAGREATKHCPSSGEISVNLATALLRTGQGEESLTILRRVVAQNPKLGRAWIALASGMSYSPDASPEETKLAHQHAAQVCGPASPRVRPANADPARRLKVGILSPDLREHSVGHFVRPVMSGSLKAHGIDVTILNSGTVRDSRNASFRAAAAEAGIAWRDLGASSKPADTDAAIRAEGLDVVIELSGLTQGQRLSGLAKRPAPVQMTYLGYPATTGCAFMDFRLVDAMTDPVGSEGHCVEALARIESCFLCYTPPSTRPGARQPADQPVNFGCFGALQKYSDRLLTLWAQVLTALPDSGLVLKSGGFEEEAVCDRILKRLGELGVEEDRIQLIGRIENAADHLDLYNTIDIALDTYPYHGTTTTCEALAMGVPTVTLVGPSHASRVGLSLLNAVGLADLAAEDDAAFVRTAVALANDRQRLTRLHETLRETLDESVLCNAAAWSKNFAGAIRTAWALACGW